MMMMVMMVVMLMVVVMMIRMVMMMVTIMLMTMMVVMLVVAIISRLYIAAGNHRGGIYFPASLSVRRGARSRRSEHAVVGVARD